MKAAGIKLTYIPFTGSGTAIPALLGGHVTGLMTYTTMAAQHRDKFRILAVAGEKRSLAFPNAPTFRELGYDIVEGAYRGVSVPPGTPDSIVKILADAFEKVNKNLSKKEDDRACFRFREHGPGRYQVCCREDHHYRELLKDIT